MSSDKPLTLAQQRRLIKDLEAGVAGVETLHAQARNDYPGHDVAAQDKRERHRLHYDTLREHLNNSLRFERARLARIEQGE